MIKALQLSNNVWIRVGENIASGMVSWIRICEHDIKWYDAYNGDYVIAKYNVRHIVCILY